MVYNNIHMYHAIICGQLTTYMNNGRGNPCCILHGINWIIMLDHCSLLPIGLNCVSDSLVFMLFGRPKNSAVL